MMQRGPAKATLLVVDDERSITALLERWLTAEGYRCHTAHSGEAALERLAAEPVDLLLTDVNMPGMSGMDLLAACRRQYPELPVIMVSAVSDREVAMQALEAGASSYLLKPFERVEVGIHVANALRLQRLEAERRQHYQGLLNIFLERNKALQRAYAELERLNLELRQQDKLAGLGQLAAGVAHELANPLSFVTANLHQLEKYVQRLTAHLQTVEGLCHDQEAVAASRLAHRLDFVLADLPELIAQSHDGLERIRELTGDLKDYSRRDAATMEEADVARLLDTARTILGGRLRHGVRLESTFTGGTTIRCHPRQITQVLINLVQNAVEASGDEGVVRVRGERQGDDLVLRVEDQGQGIPAGDLERVFEPFFSRRQGGTGLGLAICRDIVTEHGGSIEVTSREGEGTCFTLRLPVAGPGGGDG